MAEPRNHRLTYRVPLAGSQDRIRELVLYVSKMCENHEHFGKTKLYKILWRADFEAYAERDGAPVTGRPYQRLQFGPAPVDMAPLLPEMVEAGELTFKRRTVGNFTENRPIALVEPSLSLFSLDDLRFVDRAISHYEKMTGKESSDDSHGIAWRVRGDGEAMPYDSAFLSDDFSLSAAQEERLRGIVEASNSHSE